MFDPSIIIINKVPLYALKTLGITLSFETEGDTPGFQIFFTDLGLVWFQECLVCGLVSESVKTSGFALGFQHFPRDLRMLMNGKSCLIPLYNLSLLIRSLNMH